MNEVSQEQLLLATINNKVSLTEEYFDYKSLFLSSVLPDPSNSRFLPSKFISNEHAQQFISRWITKQQLVELYDAHDYVLIGKSCVINCLRKDSPDRKRAQKTIDSVLELAENISVSEMIQAPTVYPLDDGKYQIVTGHRRLFSLIYTKGYDATAQFKVYEQKPLLTKIKQFQENASREDLPKYGKLQAFLSAIMEIDTVNQANLRTGGKKLTVKETSSNLGISMGAFDNYNVLTRYPSVLKAYESGLSLSFVKVKKVVLAIESEYKKEHDKSVLNVSDKNTISDQIATQLTGEKPTVTKKTSFKINPLQSTSAIKTLLTSNIMELDTGVDWEQVDWEDHLSVSKVLVNVIDFLNNNNE